MSAKYFISKAMAMAMAKVRVLVFMTFLVVT